MIEVKDVDILGVWGDLDEETRDVVAATIELFAEALYKRCAGLTITEIKLHIVSLIAKGFLKIVMDGDELRLLPT